MFLRFANGQLVYFESSANIGVQIFSWDYFVKNHVQKNFRKLAFRKLRTNRSRDSLQSLEKFVSSVRGKGYDLSLSKLMQKKDTEEDLSSNKTSKTYFCSELVASAHKVLGVFPAHPASS